MQSVADPRVPAPYPSSPTSVKTSQRRWPPRRTISFASHQAPLGQISGPTTGNFCCDEFVIFLLGRRIFLSLNLNSYLLFEYPSAQHSKKKKKLKAKLNLNFINLF